MCKPSHGLVEPGACGQIAASRKQQRTAQAPPPFSAVLAWASGVLVFGLTTAFQLLRVPTAALSALRALLPTLSEKEAEAEPPRGWALGRLYDVLDYWWEMRFYSQLRPVICSGARGDVLELGVGTGRNLAFYPAGARVTGIDLSEEQIGVARRRADEEELACTVQALSVGNATNLKGIPDGSVDVVVSTFMFCVMPEELLQPTLSEVARVLRPGGVFRFADIQFSQESAVRRLVQAWYAPYVRFAFGAGFEGKIRQYLQAHEGLVLTRQTPLKGDTLWLLEGRKAR